MSISDFEKIRPSTFALLRAVEAGTVSAESLVPQLLMWNDEASVKQFILANDLCHVLGESDENEDETLEEGE